MGHVPPKLSSGRNIRRQRHLHVRFVELFHHSTLEEGHSGFQVVGSVRKLQRSVEVCEQCLSFVVGSAP